jgi:di/tricarboxylate transporter/CRP-like cAMP-binding protein
MPAAERAQVGSAVDSGEHAINSGVMAVRHGAREAIVRAAAELASVPPFSELSPVDRARLAAALQEVHYAAGEVIYAQGTRADALYILREGTLERQSNGVTLEVLQPPAVFGDLGLLRDEVRATTLKAMTPAVLWRLPGERFTRLARRTPAIATFFAAVLGGHLALRMPEVAELSLEFQGMAQHLYSSLSRSQQEMLEHAVLLPRLEPTVLDTPVSALPLADVVLDGAASYPPAFRRFVLGGMLERLGAQRVADARRELANRARGVGQRDLAIQVLTEGGLTAEAVELADREVAHLLSSGHRDKAVELTRLLPPDALRDHPRLLELHETGTDGSDSEETPPRGRGWPIGRKTTALACGAILLVALWPLPAPEGLSDRGWHALVTLVASVPLLAVEALPDGIVALMIAGVWVAGGVTQPRIALGGFATTQWVLVVSTLAVGVAIASSGLLYRMALWVVANSRGGYAGQVIGLGVAGMAVGPAAPNATSRVALVAPAVTELVDALSLKPGSRETIGLAMAVLIGFGQVVALFLTSSTTSVLVYAVLPESTRASVSWGSWFLRALPTHVLLFAALAAFIVWRYRPRGKAVAGSTASLDLQRALLGPPSRHELIAIGVTLFMLIGFSTQPLHHLDPAWVGVIALAVLAGSGVFSANGLGAVNWSFALLSGVLTSMSDVFSDTQLDTWLAGLATQLVGGLASTPVLFVAALTLLCFGLSLVMRWQAAAPLLTISMAPVGLAAGIDPWVIGMIALMACNGFFLPYQSTTYLALYHGTNGRLFSHSQARPMAFAYGAVTLLALCASVPLWRAMGLV